MTFLSKYKEEDRWWVKVIMMEMYHFERKIKIPGWTIRNLAEDFGLSVGLCSENLQIAESIHTDAELMNCKSRAEALKRISIGDKS